MKHSVFTVMMGAEYSANAVVDRLSALGYDGVEWRVRDDFHVSPRDLPQQAEKLKELAGGRGLETCALATYIPTSDIELLSSVFEGAAILGAGVVRVSPPGYNRSRTYHDLFHEAIEGLRKVEELAARTGVKAVVEIHMGTIIPSPCMARRLVDRFDPQYVGVTFDPGNMVVEGMENWRMGLEVLGEYLAHVHVKNMGWFQKPEGGWMSKCVPLVEGIADWSQVLADLKAVGYDGWLSLEDFSARPVDEKLEGGIGLLREIESR